MCFRAWLRVFLCFHVEVVHSQLQIPKLYGLLAFKAHASGPRVACMFVGISLLASGRISRSKSVYHRRDLHVMPLGILDAKFLGLEMKVVLNGVVVFTDLKIRTEHTADTKQNQCRSSRTAGRKPPKLQGATYQCSSETSAAICSHLGQSSDCSMAPASGLGFPDFVV